MTETLSRLAMDEETLFRLNRDAVIREAFVYIDDLISSPGISGHILLKALPLTAALGQLTEIRESLTFRGGNEPPVDRDDT